MTTSQKLPEKSRLAGGGGRLVASAWGSWDQEDCLPGHSSKTVSKVSTKDTVFTFSVQRRVNAVLRTEPETRQAP